MPSSHRKAFPDAKAHHKPRVIEAQYCAPREAQSGGEQIGARSAEHGAECGPEYGERRPLAAKSSEMAVQWDPLRDHTTDARLVDDQRQRLV